MTRCRCKDCPECNRGGRRSVVRGVAAAAAVGAVLAVASHAGGHHHGLHGVLDSVPKPPSPSALPAGIGTSRLAWAKAFLREIPEPVTTCNKAAVVAWETAEGGGFGNQATGDPLDLNPSPSAPWPGHHVIGAWAFPTPRIGLAYTVKTVRNYPGILAALHQGNDAQNVANQIEASPWATSHYHWSLTAAC